MPAEDQDAFLRAWRPAMEPSHGGPVRLEPVGLGVHDPQRMAQRRDDRPRVTAGTQAAVDDPADVVDAAPLDPTALRLGA